MNNAWITEIYKLKKNKMALIGLLATISIPVLLFLKSVLIDQTKIEYPVWLLTVSMLINLVFPIMSGFFITQSIQKEYGEKTIINIITAPVKRTTFIFAKIAVWLCWYGLILVITEILTLLGSYLLYPAEMDIASLMFAIRFLTQTALFSFIAFLPVLWFCIKQRTLFYPSMLCTLVFVMLQAVGSQVSEEFLSVLSFVPWLAVSISSMVPTDSHYFYSCVLSIFCSGIIGVLLTIREFRRQDL